MPCACTLTCVRVRVRVRVRVHVHAHTDLTRLGLRGCASITDASLRHMHHGLRKLEHVNLRGCPLVTCRAVDEYLGHVALVNRTCY